MLTVVLSILAGLVAGAAFKPFLHSIWGCVPPALIALVVVAALLLRRAAATLDPTMKSVEKHLAARRPELALKALREALPIGLWHPILPGQLRIQIGALEYAAGNLDAAESELSRASRWPWISRAFLGCVRFKRHDDAGMRKAFNTAIKVGDKEGLAYTMYAYCLMARDANAEAVTVLEQGLKKIPGDHRLQVNLELAKEGKKLKVAPYGDQWSRFGLESGEGPVVPKAARGFAARPGFRQKPMRKK